jgi:hypothetical protein
MDVSSDHQVIRRAIERGDYLRRATARLADAGNHKEWFHFCVTSRELDVFVNFSLVDDTRPGAPERAEVARLVCAVRTEHWDGDVEHFESHEVTANAGRLGLRMGDNYVHYSGGTFRVVAALRRRPVLIDLSFTPVTLASQVNNIGLGDSPPMQWFVVPKLLANGEVQCGGRHFTLENVPAYHDHNWGYFRWGQDFRWTWGYGHAHTAHSPWVIAFDRLSNRARNIDFLRGLLLWKGARQFRVFQGPQVEIASEGFLRPEHVLKLPRIMGLLRSEGSTDVPEKLRARAAARGDVLELEFTSKHVCQLVAPNDEDLGVTVINEVSGDLQLSGEVRGERIEVDGRAMFEFLGG